MLVRPRLRGEAAVLFDASDGFGALTVYRSDLRKLRRRRRRGTS